MENKRIYLDYNATTPVHSEVLTEMIPYFTEQFWNAASSTHRDGRVIANKVDTIQKSIANNLNIDYTEFVFTSGATESLNLAIKGVYQKYHKKGKHIVCASTEHKAVTDTCDFLAKNGAEITYLSSSKSGLIDLKELESAIRKDTVLVICMLANNETGIIENIPAIANIVHEKNSILLSDTTQAWGKISFELNELNIDLAPISAHKIYGPKGQGGLFVRRRSPRVVLEEQIHGGGHQKARRSGTLNVPGIVGMGKSISLLPSFIEKYSHIETLRNNLEDELLKTGKIQVVGKEQSRLPNTSMLLFEGIKSEQLITKCPQLSLATGSACTSANPQPSHVLMAMGYSQEEALSAIRISLGIDTTKEDIEQTIMILSNLVQ